MYQTQWNFPTCLWCFLILAISSYFISVIIKHPVDLSIISWRIVKTFLLITRQDFTQLEVQIMCRTLAYNRFVIAERDCGFRGNKIKRLINKFTTFTMGLRSWTNTKQKLFSLVKVQEQSFSFKVWPKLNAKVAFNTTTTHRKLLSMFRAS